jgi:ubiquinone/menaquinone biosynthesis C-methylase UbiE
MSFWIIGEMPFSGNTFDTFVGTLVFCTIPDPVKALDEIQRVCKPEGKLLLFRTCEIQ